MGADLIWHGSVVSISITPVPGQPMQSIDHVRAVAGAGLEGDRYFRRADKAGPDREVTLIEAEAIEALESEHGLKLDPRDARRNIVTRGVPLNHLVDREFQVGEVTLRGIRLCEPCDHLARLTHENVLPGLVHRGGLRAQILRDGVIRVGDSVREQ